MKCTQCGSEDLVQADFPQNAYLITTEIGLSGYSNSYSIVSDICCDSYICVNCGHYEFFNSKLIEKIKSDRKTKKEIKTNIANIKNDIIELTNKIAFSEKQIEDLRVESSNLDITLRRNNEIQEMMSNLYNEIKSINKIISDKETELIKLKETFNNLT